MNLPSRLAHQYGKLLPVRCFALPFEMSPIRETLHWHRAGNDDPAHRWLRRQFKDAAARLPSAAAAHIDGADVRHPHRACTPQAVSAAE